MNLVRRIAGAARLLATGKLALSSGFDGAQMQRRLVAWRAGGESINNLILQGGELQRARARQLVRTNDAIVAMIMALVRTMVAIERADTASRELSGGGHLCPRLWCEHLADSPTMVCSSKMRIPDSLKLRWPVLRRTWR